MSAPNTKTGWREIALFAGSCLLTLLFLEGFARLWVALRWPEQRIEQMTARGSYRGRFEIAAPFGYTLRPNHRSTDDHARTFTHNSLGFRNEEFPRQKPLHQIRIALLGASTIYGLTVSDQDTGSSNLQRNLQASFPGSDILVVNAGVPGWISVNTVQSLEHRVLPIEPDVIVVMDGRNELGPEGFVGYRDDSTHYETRDPNAIAAVQEPQRRLFRTSRLAMLIAHRAPALFDYRPHLFSPVYSRVQWENQPTEAQLISFAGDDARFQGYRNNLKRIVALARAHSVTPVLATIFLDLERFQTDLLPTTEEGLRVQRRMAMRNIEITREVAREESVPLFDGFALTKSDLMADDCHPNEKGERLFAAALAEVLAPVLRDRIAAAAAK